MDGTLIHFSIDYLKARRMVIDIFERYGYPKGILSTKDLIFEMTKKVEQYFLESGMEKAAVEKIIKEANEAVISVERENIQNARIVEGISPILQYFADKAIKMSVCTFNTTPVAIECLKAVGILNYFMENGQLLIFGRDKAEKRPKPDPFHYELALHAFGTRGNEVLVIGDHPKDIAGGNAIGAKSIAIIREGYEPKMFNTDLHILQSELPEKLLPLIQSLIEK